MPANINRARGVRWNKDTLTFEMWCPSCEAKGNTATFWPLDPEYWAIGRTLQTCKACNAESKRRAEKTRRAAKRDELVAANRVYYQDNRELLRWKDNARKKAKRDEALRTST
jgi:hypothetical protein